MSDSGEPVGSHLVEVSYHCVDRSFRIGGGTARRREMDTLPKMPCPPGGPGFVVLLEVLDILRGMTPGLAVLNIVEIVLNVDDLPKMRDFYIRVFNFPLHSEVESEDPAHPVRPGEPTICFLKVASSDTPLGRAVHPPFLVLIDYKRHGRAKSRFLQTDQKHSTLNHIAFEIAPEAYHPWFERLTQEGLEPFETVFENVEGKAMFVKDPEGNSIELICHESPRGMD